MGQPAEAKTVARRARQEGNPRPLWTFRPTAALAAYIEAKLEREGLEKSGTILDMLEIAQGITEEMGVDYFEVERQAKVEGVPPGVILGRLAKQALDKKGRR